jgi:hypothetical protein
MDFKVLPVSFVGLRWGHPGHRHGRRWQPDSDVPDKLAGYEERLPAVAFEELLQVDDPESVDDFLQRAHVGHGCSRPLPGSRHIARP